VKIFGRSERRAREREARASGRLPPGQSLTEKYPVLTYESQREWPPNDLSQWRLDVTGVVKHSFQLDFQTLTREFDVVDLAFDIHCVTRWSKLDTKWKGVRVRDVLARAAPEPSARFLITHSTTGYTANVPLEHALAETSLITWEYAGQPLAPEHGGPVRAIIDPETLYLWKSAKFLRSLEVTAEDNPGFWERLGYHNGGNIWAEERFWEDSGLQTRRQVMRRAGEP